MKCAHSWTISPKCSWICRSRHYCREYIHIQPHTSLNCEGDSDPNWSTEVWKFIGLHIQTLEMHRWSKNPCIHHVGSPVDQVAFKNCRWTCFKLPHIHILLIRSTQPRILDRNQAQRDCTIKPLDSCCRFHFTWRTQMQLLFTWSQKCAELQFRFLDIQPNELRSKWDHKDQVYKLVAQTAAMQISVIQRLYCSLVITLNTDPAVTIYTCLFQTPLPWEKERIGICRPYISRVTCLLIGHIKLRGLHAWAMAARLLNSKQSAPPQSSHEIKSGAPEQVKCFSCCQGSLSAQPLGLPHISPPTLGIYLLTLTVKLPRLLKIMYMCPSRTLIAQHLQHRGIACA